ncbi:MAG: hypothetical protein IPF84_08400 [Proteobacteria bacterium]|nr:hypothetical protein [Pseudomonadota bacterium]
MTYPLQGNYGVRTGRSIRPGHHAPNAWSFVGSFCE